MENLQKPRTYRRLYDRTVPVDEKGAPARSGVNGGMYRKDQPEQKPVNYILVNDINDVYPENQGPWRCHNATQAAGSKRRMDCTCHGPRRQPLAILQSIR